MGSKKLLNAINCFMLKMGDKQEILPILSIRTRKSFKNKAETRVNVIILFSFVTDDKA